MRPAEVRPQGILGTCSSMRTTAASLESNIQAVFYQCLLCLCACCRCFRPTGPGIRTVPRWLAGPHIVFATHATAFMTFKTLLIPADAHTCPSTGCSMVDSAASALASSTPLEGMTQLLGSFPGGFSVDGALSSFMPTSQAETSKGMLSFSAPQPHTHATGQAAHRSLHSHGRHGAGVSGATAGRGTEGTGSQLHAVGIAAASSAVLATPTPSLAAQAAAALLASTAAAEAVPSPSPAAAPPTAMTPAGLGPVSAQQLAYALAAAAAASATTAAPPANAAVMPEAAAPSAAFFQAGISLAGEARQTPAAPMAAADAEPAVALASSPAAFSLDAPQPVSPTSVAPAEAFRGPVNLTGIWSKVPELSDLESYERALDLWEINGMQRATARLIEGLEIKHQGGNFDVHHLTVIPYFKVRCHCVPLRLWRWVSRSTNFRRSCLAHVG